MLNINYLKLSYMLNWGSIIEHWKMTTNNILFNFNMFNISYLTEGIEHKVLRLFISNMLI